MKRLFLSFIIVIAAFMEARGQYVVLGNIQGNMGSIQASVIDSTSLEPLPYASVYIIPRKDTTITNFALTDTTGVALMRDVPYGAYTFNVELMGYKPYSKSILLNDWRKNMGIVKLQVDDKFLEAAVISDVGNPIVVKQDTIEYNASSFRVGSNAVLKDLLAKMPGFEFTEDGKVKVNGEEVDRITVNGRTFFFGDQATTLNNLPAKVVDKIRVIDKDTKQKQATGVDDGAKEKVMDVALKKEYEKGWFGNIGAMGGTTLSREDEHLRDNRGLLFNANALLSNFNPKDQVTLIANGMNVASGDEAIAYYRMGDDADMPRQGLNTGAQLAGSFNTVRIKDVETSVTLGYRYSGTDFGSETYRTTYQDAGDLYAESKENGVQGSNSVNANMEFEKSKGNFTFNIRPSFNWRQSSSSSESSSRTDREGAFLNSSSGRSESQASAYTSSLYGRMSFANIGDKKRRSITLIFGGHLGGSEGASSDYSLTKFEGREDDLRDLHYISGGRSYGFNTGLQYVEPLSEKLLLLANTSVSYSKSSSDKLAYNADGSENEYYTSLSDNDYIRQNYEISLQY